MLLCGLLARDFDHGVLLPVGHKRVSVAPSNFTETKLGQSQCLDAESVDLSVPIGLVPCLRAEPQLSPVI